MKCNAVAKKVQPLSHQMSRSFSPEWCMCQLIVVGEFFFLFSLLEMNMHIGPLCLWFVHSSSWSFYLFFLPDFFYISFDLFQFRPLIDISHIFYFGSYSFNLYFDSNSFDFSSHSEAFSIFCSYLCVYTLCFGF